MIRPNDYDKTTAAGDYRKLPAGGYVCKVVKATEERTKSGLPMLKVAIDIAQGEYANFYKDAYAADTRQDKKWPAGGTAYIVSQFNDGRTNPVFKAFCTSVEESNGMELSWGTDFGPQLKNKAVGIIFREEEYLNNDNAVRVSVKPYGYRSVEVIRNGMYQVPEIKRIDEAPVPAKVEGAPEGFEAIPDDFLPF